MVIDAELVKRLISSQFPEWADLAVTPVQFDGWDNRTFRLGAHLSVRLPSASGYVDQVQKEQRWLPVLAPQLPLPIPAPVALGHPEAGYPYPWSVYRWLEGEIATVGRISDLVEFAGSLGRFLVALRAIDATDGPPPGPHNFYRGGPLTVYDTETREALAILGDTIDGGAATEVWQTALAARWAGGPVWFHGDVSRGNLLLGEGRLRAVIDFGTCGVGDPSCDLAIAWTMFRGESRSAFREAVQLDRGTWARGRGWAIWKALIVAAGMAGSNSANYAETSRRVIDEVIADHAATA
jgi:aminoglycoside phosphotransferase (APT) family kinase protein